MKPECQVRNRHLGRGHIRQIRQRSKPPAKARLDRRSLTAAARAVGSLLNKRLRKQEGEI